MQPNNLNMALVFLVGRHGSGKSTIGQALAKVEGYGHISVGLLRRLAAANEFPADIPVSLMFAMKKVRSGEPLTEVTAQRLIKYAESFEHCVIDGFPVTPDQLALVPKNSHICVVTASKDIRLSRLQLRAAKSLRQWTPGIHSEREKQLAALIWTARKSKPTIFIPNNHDGAESILAAMSRIKHLQK